MTESQLKLFQAFRSLPVFDEKDKNSNSITTVHGASGYRSIKECATLQEVADLLSDSRYEPLGGIRVNGPDGPIAAAYFGEKK